MRGGRQRRGSRRHARLDPQQHAPPLQLRAVDQDAGRRDGWRPEGGWAGHPAQFSKRLLNVALAANLDAPAQERKRSGTQRMRWRAERVGHQPNRSLAAGDTHTWKRAGRPAQRPPDGLGQLGQFSHVGLATTARTAGIHHVAATASSASAMRAGIRAGPGQCLVEVTSTNPRAAAI
jgi:hypothetical protein